MPPAQKYLAQYNGYTLPGYVQQEAINSTAGIGNHQAPYADASLSEYTGLVNKDLALTLKIWQCSYAEAKEEVQRAATILRSFRDGFAPLRIQFPDRYYEAIVEKISAPKDISSSIKTRDYTIDFDCKPWLVHDTVQTITGTGLQSTATRTIADGGWTPTTLTISGSNVTVSGYTAEGLYTGFLSIDGTVSNMVIDSELQTATVGGVNAVDQMLWADFGVHVAPGVTYFDIQNASSCQIQYQNRWYI